MLTLVGSLMTANGFYWWHVKVQKYEDMILKRKAAGKSS
jgi:hypothetical protein